MAVSSVETGPRIFMDPDNKDITPEQSRRHLIDERRRLFHDSRGVKIPVNDLTDQEYSEVTGYNITEKPEVAPLVQTTEPSKSVEGVSDEEYVALTGYKNVESQPVQAQVSQPTKAVITRIREFLSHFPKPNTPQRNPV